MILSTPYRSTLKGLGDSPNCADLTISCGAIGPVDCVGNQSDVKTDCAPLAGTPCASITLPCGTTGPVDCVGLQSDVKYACSSGTVPTGVPLQGQPCNLGGYVNGLTNFMDPNMGFMPVLQYFTNFSCDPMYVAGVMTPAVLGLVLVMGLLGNVSFGGGGRRRR